MTLCVHKTQARRRYVQHLWREGSSASHLTGYSMVNAGILVLKVFLVTPLVWTSADGEPQVIGCVLPIFAAPGSNVLLPCHLEPPLNVEELTIEWSRPDLQPSPSDRLSQLRYVHVHRQRHEVQDMKSPLYVGRTSLFEDELRRGNISLKITNVTVEDEGRYKCFVPELRGGVKEAFVRLFVEPTAVKTTVAWFYPTEFPTTGPVENNDKGVRTHYVVFIVVFLVLLLVTGGCILKNCLTVNNINKLLEKDILGSRWNKMRCVKRSGFLHESDCFSLQV